jgi:hypothetical protein
MYGRVFESMYEGTLHGHWEAIVTFQQMLVLCNSDGVIDMTPHAIAARTSIPLEIITKGIKILSEPDPYSRTPGEDGKRIVLVDEHRPWGWLIVNHAKYQALRNRQDKLDADRLRIAEKRKASKNSDVAVSRNPSQHVADVAHADASTDASPTTNAGESRARAAAHGTRLPLDWTPPDPWMRWAMQERKWSWKETLRVAESFKNYYLAKPGKDGESALWEATWKRWVERERTNGAPGILPNKQEALEARNAAICDNWSPPEDPPAMSH